jgi:hypothetical protein
MNSVNEEASDEAASNRFQCADEAVTLQRIARFTETLDP